MLGFGVLRFAQQGGKRGGEGASVPGGCTSPAKAGGRRAADRPVVAARKGRPREGRDGERREREEREAGAGRGEPS